MFGTFFSSSSYSNPNRVINFTTNGATFSPIIIVAEGADVLWTFEGGTSTSSNPTIDFGSVGIRNVSLTVNPWSSLQLINIGYDGADGGSSSDVRPELFQMHTTQGVSAISGLQFATGLLGFAANYTNISQLSFNNLQFIERIEFFGGDLITVSFGRCFALRRVCIEENAVTSIYDLSDCPLVEDVRGALNSFPTVLWADGSLDNCWHICIREQIMPADAFPDISRLPAIQDFYVSGTGRTGIWDLSNSSTLRDIWLFGNQITELIITGSPNVVSIFGHDNLLTQTAVDNVLVTLDNNGLTNGYVDLTANSIPSATGLAAVASLQGKGWSVGIDN